ncbi:hypothetical protein C2G38_2174619 [Gigaspora rosea]|uniref:Peptidase S1 domain-containing protein n=1 Tax=Gigaspora rosea TaxID=44941 RepID=A0A397VT03_9GLOM|nr:hypothetical protein C2G38_2174619 [Gigaspora rosea]
MTCQDDSHLPGQFKFREMLRGPNNTNGGHICKIANSDLLEFVQAFYSTTKLKSNLGGIRKLADVYNGFVMGYIDIEFNNIVITSCLADRSQNNRFLTAIKIYEPYPKLSFYICAAGINNTSTNDMGPKFVVKQIVKEILAGDGIYSPSEINGSIGFTACSAGFWARDQANINYIATTGHCFDDSDLFNLRTQIDPSDLIGQMIYHLQSPDFGLNFGETLDQYHVYHSDNHNETRMKP